MLHCVHSLWPSILVFSKEPTFQHFHGILYLKFQLGCLYITTSLVCRDLTGLSHLHWCHSSQFYGNKRLDSRAERLAASSLVPERTLSSGMLWFTKKASPFSDSARCNCAATLRTVDLQGASTVSRGQQRVPCMKTSYWMNICFRGHDMTGSLCKYTVYPHFVKVRINPSRMNAAPGNEPWRMFPLACQFTVRQCALVPHATTLRYCSYSRTKRKFSFENL